MIHFNALDFNECRSDSEEVISFFWRSVYILPTDNIFHDMPVETPQNLVNQHLVYSQLVYYPLRLIAQPRFSGLGLGF